LKNSQYHLPYPCGPGWYANLRVVLFLDNAMRKYRFPCSLSGRTFPRAYENLVAVLS